MSDKTRSLTCGNKKKHATKGDAASAMHAYRRRALKGLPIRAEAYKCGDHWHWGHVSGKRKGKR